MTRLADSLRGKTVLLTGGTGFLGKVIVERLLRCAPDIGCIYLLIRARQDEDAPRVSPAMRFETEVVPSRAFSRVARLHGHRWPAYARDTLVPVAGDVSLPRLGFDDHHYAALASRVDVVINAAASVVFDEPLDGALLHNVRSVEHVTEFARACRRASLVHISTAFVAGRLPRTFIEGPLTPDVSVSETAAIEETIAAVTRQAEAERWRPHAIRTRLVEEGMARARRLGWHDVYSYTKALGEMVVARDRGHVPTAIIRPAIVESSLRDPAPGWLENLNVGDPLWVEFGRGRMVDFPLAADAVLDMVPVDFVANAVLAALPRIGESADVSYFTVGSGSVNPLTGSSIHELTFDYFTRNPMYDLSGRPIAVRRMTFPTVEQFRRMSGEEAGLSSRMKRLRYLADLYESYTNARCIFDTANARRLLDGLHPADRDAFGFDVRHIDWRAYIQEVHIPGLRRHVLHEERGMEVGDRG